MKKKLSLSVIIVGWAILVLGAAGVWGQPVTKGPYKSDNDLVIIDKPFGVSISVDEIWEVLQIIEQRLPDKNRLWTTLAFDPCTIDELCLAKRQVERIETERKENEKIEALIRKFREVMK